MSADTHTHRPGQIDIDDFLKRLDVIFGAVTKDDAGAVDQRR
jgi:hypothetical protein